MTILSEVISTYFNDDKGNPFTPTPSQEKIIESIYYKDNPRVQIIAPTRYGKSATVAIAVVLCMYFKNEKFAIVAGSQPKADIIMQKVIEFISHNSEIYKELEMEGTETIDRLKRERSKKRTTFKTGGEVRTYSADSRNKQRVLDSLLGFGCSRIIEDESALIGDDLQAMVMRMLGDSPDNFLCKIGNPSFRNHFFRTWNSPKYQKIFIDYKIALEEGRYSQEFIDEMKQEPYFDVLYECKFPGENEIDLMGYRKLYKELKKGKAEHKGKLILGVDIGEGNDETVAILKSDTFAEVVHKSRIKDLMTTTREIENIIKKYKPNEIYIDKLGVGSGVFSRLLEIGYDVQGIQWSEKASDSRFFNKKAENFFNSSKWKGTLSDVDDWSELDIIRYKEDSSGKLRIKTKEEYRKEGIKSPNIADAFALCFNRQSQPEIYIY